MSGMIDASCTIWAPPMPAGPVLTQTRDPPSVYLENAASALLAVRGRVPSVPSPLASYPPTRACPTGLGT